MMLYFVRTDDLNNNPRPRGGFHYTVCPGNPNWSLCLVVHWADDTADDEWEAATGATPIYVENYGALVPTIAVTALGPWGVVGTDTIRQAFKKVKPYFSVISMLIRR